jgi:hypothetical protein
VHSLLCPHQAAQNPAFQDWFGASQAVDDRGLPLLVAHGTEHAFDAFCPSRIDRRSTRPAFWFASHRACGFYGPRRVLAYLRLPHLLHAPDGRLTFWVQHALAHNFALDLDGDGTQPRWDGVVFRDVVDGDTPSDVWAVFEPSSIKSPCAASFDLDDARFTA